MNKKFLSAILFGALMVTSTGTFVSCKDYDDDIENLTNDLAAQKSQLEQQIAALESQMSSLDAATKAQLEQLKKDLAAANAEQLAKIQAALDEMKKTMTSLVFIPQAYVGGVEAMSIETINYTSYLTEEVDADGDFLADEPVSDVPVQMTDMFKAQYHVNPSTVTSEDVVDVKFLAMDKESRAYADVITTEVYNWDVTGGVLNVFAKITDGSIKEDETITVMAAQAQLKKAGEEVVTVTSDYAVASPKKTAGFHLAFVSATEDAETAQCTPLYLTAKAAKESEAVQVAWNSELDLAKVVCAHYTDETLFDVAATAGAFELEYELVGWKSGKNQTSESAHAAISGSVLRPQMANADGTQAAYGAAQNQATIGRQPIVRVTLKDNVTGKKAAVGYLKIEIVATPGKNTVGAEASFDFDKEFTLSCTTDYFTNKVKWYEVENDILAELNISKEEFRLNYVFDETLYKSYNKEDGKAVELGLGSKTIKVEKGIDTEDGTTTEVLKMIVHPNYAYEYFLAGNEEMTVIVRYAKETGLDAFGNQTYDYVYVTLTWAPDPLNVKPEGTIANEDKMQQYWFAKNSAEAGSGYDEIHVNVNVPGEPTVSTENFDKAILETFVDDDITISGVAEVYADFQDEDLTKELVFAATQSTTPIVGVSGTSYVIAAGVNNKELYAYEIVGDVVSTEGEIIATLSEDGTIAYYASEAAKDILNAAGRDALANNATATILVKETNECGKSLVKLENNTFDVKFLRPITVEQGEMDSFKDGVDVAAKGSVVAVNLSFTDWRGYAFEEDYYTHYGIESIECVKSEITTNVSGKWDKLPSGMKVDYTEATTIGKVDEEGNADFGTLTYVNNNAEVGNFSIKVPFVVNYVWGQIKLTVEVKVEKTVG